MGSWLSKEPWGTLRCPSKQRHKQLKGSSYLRGEWHGHFASWRKERSRAKEVVKERTEGKGQWQEGEGMRKEWSRIRRATTKPGGKQQDCLGPDHTPCNLVDKSRALPWTSKHDWWFYNPNYTLLEVETIVVDIPRIIRVLSQQATIVKEAVSYLQLANGVCPKPLIQGLNVY